MTASTHRRFAPVPETVERIAKTVLDAAFEVHTHWGPGLLESLYRRALMEELAEAGLRVRSEVEVPVFYKGRLIDGTHRLDLLVEDELVIELKAVERLHYVHRAQLLTYLRLANKPLGLLINFNVPHLRHGIRRVIL